MKTTLIKALIILSVTCYSCADNLTSLNIDEKNATSADGATFFANGLKEFSDHVWGNAYQATGPGSTKLFAQLLTSVTYLDGTHYIENFSWTTLYRDIIKDFDEGTKAIAALEPITPDEQLQQQNQLAILEIMTVYAYAVLVDSYGNIPYTEAMDFDNVLPVYDDAKTIYLDLIDRLSAAVSNLDPSGTGFNGADIIYNGDVTKWRKFGNSLKLKLGMRIVDAEPSVGAQAIISAVDDGVFSSNDDNAIFRYLPNPPNHHPWYGSLVIQPLRYYVGTKPLVDYMNTFNDPRRKVYFIDINGEFKGAESGLPHNYFDYSSMGSRYFEPDFENIFLDYASVEFYLAEAAERGIGSITDPESHYNAAIRASLAYNGVGDEADAYLAQPAVNYQTAEGNWKKKIGVQKWIALFDQGFEAWSEYRRLDYPELQAPAAARSNVVPRRFLYPITEQSVNGQNYTAAASAIGGDTYETKLFWDIY